MDGQMEAKVDPGLVQCWKALILRKGSSCWPQLRPIPGDQPRPTGVPGPHIIPSPLFLLANFQMLIPSLPCLWACVSALLSRKLCAPHPQDEHR